MSTKSLRRPYDYRTTALRFVSERTDIARVSYDIHLYLGLMEIERIIVAKIVQNKQTYKRLVYERKNNSRGISETAY